MSIDQQFVEFVIKSLVSKPDEVKIERRIDEKGVLLELTVDPEDLGRVIGKRGATAQSVRTLLRALGTKNDARYNLKIVDNGTPPPNRSEDRGDSRDDNRVAERGEEPAAEPDVETTVEQQPEEKAAGAEEDAWTTSSSEAKVDDSEPEENDTLAKTRKELEDLDDLDV